MPSKTFRFSLQSVSDLRAREAEQAEQALAQVLQACAVQEEAVQQAQARLDAIVQGVERARTQGLHAVRQQEAFRRDARREVVRAVQLLESHRRQAEQARRVLRLRNIARESLDTLRTREQQRHTAAQQQADGAQLDEQALSIYRRRPSAS